MAEVADVLASSLRPLAAKKADSSSTLDDRVAGRLLGDHSDSVLNDAQRLVTRVVEALLRDPAV